MSDPQTMRLYYADAKLCTFTARIVEQKAMALSEAVPEAERVGDVVHAVRLDQTAFYPTSGGQPYDKGVLGDVPVIEVLEDDEGRIWHLVAQPLESSAPVRGEIDWARRFDHMQQHSGQHLLSASCEQHLAAPTVGFHLGREASTIDLEIPDLSWDEIGVIEDDVNVVIWDNRTMAIKTLSQQQVTNADAHLGLPLRKPPTVSGDIRVILVDGYDASACGGTHVSATGEIGMLKITAVEHYKAGMRVTFLCGGRALRDYQQAQRILQASSLTLSVGREELQEAIARIEERERSARRELRQLRTRLMAYEADSLWRSAPELQGMRVIVVYDEERGGAEVRALAGQLREREGTLILLAGAGDASDSRRGLHLVVARSDDLSSIDAATILRDVAALLGGRGGGSPSLAQGGAPPHGSEPVMAAFRRVLGQQGIEIRGQ